MSVHKDKNSNTWSFRKRVRDIKGNLVNVRKRGFKTKKEAQKAEAMYTQFEGDVDYLTFDTMYEKFLYQESKSVKESTIYSKKLIIKKYILEYFKNRKLKDISNEDIYLWHEQLKKQNLSLKRLNRVHMELNALFDYANTFYGLANNPARLVGGFKDNGIKQIKMLIWTPEEFNLFINEVINESYKMFFNILYYTGLRKGEALALKWSDISFNNEKITINKTLTYKYAKNSNSKNTYIITSPKTNSSNRMVDIPQGLINLLQDYKKRMEMIYGKIKSDDFVFGIDRPLSLTTMDRYKNNACKNANVKQIRIHDFRHSHASLLISMNINPLFISERLGHKNVSTTLDTYSHLFPTNQKEIVLKLNDIMKI